MQELFILGAGILAGFLGSTVGGGGFISIPILLFLGFSPQAAIALNKVGDIGTFASAVTKYWKSKKIDWHLASIIAGIYIVGSVVGTQVMVRLNAAFLEVLIVLSILLIAPLLFFNKKIGLKKIQVSRAKKAMGFIALFFLAIEGAVIGAGGALLSTLVMMYFFGYEIVKGHATTTPSKVFSALIPAVIYSFYGFVELVPAIMIFLGMLIGGFLGAHTAIKKGNRWIKALFTVVLIIFVIRILLF